MKKTVKGKIETKEAFKAFVDKFYKANEKPWATAIFQIFRDEEQNIISVKFLTINIEEAYGTAAVLAKVAEVNLKEIGRAYAALSAEEVNNAIFNMFYPFLNDGGTHANIDALRWGFDNSIELGFTTYMSKSYVTEEPVGDVIDAHFRLALLSRIVFQPRALNLTGCFDNLVNLVYTNKGAHTPAEWNKSWFTREAQGEYPLALDRFPPMVWANPMPAGTRIANVDVVRNGAHLAPGTTVMHYGFVNFNAGTLGKAMVEGRISAGTVIGDGTDVGAGAGFLGTLSGGGTVQMSTGKNCLIGAMAEVGIPLGDNVCIAAGVVFTGNTPVLVIVWQTDSEGEYIIGEDDKPLYDQAKTYVAKAKDLTGISDVTFRRNSLDGSIEVIPIPNGHTLNSILHKNSGKK